jgi:hypothetical protein
MRSFLADGLWEVKLGLVHASAEALPQADDLADDDQRRGGKALGCPLDAAHIGDHDLCNDSACDRA